MGADQMPFENNWAYLKTEMCWLDRLLMLAVARQRKEAKTVGEVASAKGDRVSAHWWKGVIAVSKPGYDDTRVPTSAKIVPLGAQTDISKTVLPEPQKERKKAGYQQQLEARIQASAKENTVLALPSLRHYLNLTLFEKNLLLLALAPEINRRYGRLYHFLQTGEDCTAASDLPTLDLALRLLCRNDLERRRARAKLTTPGSLIEKRILQYVAPYPTTTRLNSYLQLNDDWVDYLLSEQPDQHILFSRLATPREPSPPVLALPAPTPATRAVKIVQPEISWDKVILPATLLTQLQTLGQQTAASLLTRYVTSPKSTASGPHIAVGGIPMQISAPPTTRSQIALIIGEAGTGKTTAAGAIAASCGQPLCTLDLRQVHPIHWKEVLESLEATRYPVLYIRAASLWFGRNSPLPKAELAQWLHQRHTSPGLTLLSARYIHTLRASWRQQMDTILTLPLPNKSARKLLWRQAFTGIVCDEIDWDKLAGQLKLSGGSISNIAKVAVMIAQHKNAKAIRISHIEKAITQRGRAVERSDINVNDIEPT